MLCRLARVTDGDCCTVPGECDEGFDYLCAPYGSTGGGAENKFVCVPEG